MSKTNKDMHIHNTTGKPKQSPTTIHVEPEQPEKKSQDSLGLRLFTFTPDNQIRVEIINNEPWFVARDICHALGIVNSRKATSVLEDDEKSGVIISYTRSKGLATQRRKMIAVNESGLYTLIFQSRKPIARKFRKWVTSEMLPTLRKIGEYQTRKRRSHNAPVPANSNIAQLLQLIAGYLQKGDRKIIANQLDVNPVSVTNVLSGKTKSSGILQALCEKAQENRQNGFVNAYSSEFVLTAIEKLI
jgi:prophage antirepressor-like protein